MGLENQHVNEGCPMFVAHSLRGERFDASDDGTGRGTPMVPVAVADTLVSNGDAHSGFRDEKGRVPLTKEICDANAEEARPAEFLRELRRQIGEEAFRVWAHGGPRRVPSSEVLRSGVHGARLRLAAGKGQPIVDDCPLPRPEDLPAGALRELWQRGPDGRSPQERELARQLAEQPSAAVPELSHQVPSWAVRRLTPLEAERLMGFPDDFTRIPYRGKPSDKCPDGPRYKALGNSWAVNCADWLAERIGHVEAILQSEAA